MRKLLIGILIIALLVLAGYMLIDRVKIADLEILGIQAIVDKNDALDQKILSATKLATVTYQSKLDTLQAANEKLQQEKTTYENYITSDAEGGTVSQIQSYEVEYLWTKIGNYAKREGVVLKMDVEVNNAVIGTYNLNFTVAGTYVGITEFIYDLDNDSSLLFKVESFKLLPNGSSSTTTEKDDKEDNEGTTTTQSDLPLVATFKCNDISINIDSKSVSGTNNNLVEENMPTEQNIEENTNKTENNTKSTNDTENINTTAE